MSDENDWEFKVDDPKKGKIANRESLASVAKQKKEVKEKKLRLDIKKQPLRKTRSEYVEKEVNPEDTPAEKIKGKILGNIQLILFLIVLGVVGYFVWPLFNK